MTKRLVAEVKRWLSAGRRSVDALLPRACLFCESATAGGPLCRDCSDEVPGAARPRCPRCALPVACADPPHPDQPCPSCRDHPPSWQRLIVAGDYDAPLDAAIVALKYGHRTALARPLGELLAGACQHTAFDVLVPMPLAAGRLAERGFNPARLLARALLSTRTGACPALVEHPMAPARLLDALIRQRETRSQAGQPREARIANVAGAFAACQRLDGLTVALLDDVVTTGATLQAASEALLAGGARTVIGLAVARTADHRPDRDARPTRRR